MHSKILVFKSFCVDRYAISAINAIDMPGQQKKILLDVVFTVFGIAEQVSQTILCMLKFMQK